MKTKNIFQKSTKTPMISTGLQAQKDYCKEKHSFKCKTAFLLPSKDLFTNETSF